MGLVKILAKVVLAICFVLNACVGTAGAESALTAKGYVLDKVVIFSRHNIRSPLSGEGSVQMRVTPHQWFRWTAPTGQLSLHGALAETLMGQYFRQYLEDEGFMPACWQPGEGQVRFYANSCQRTIATARYFAAGMLPVADVSVESHMALNHKDPVFLPNYDKVAEKLQAKCLQDNDAMYGGRGTAGMAAAVAGDFPSLEKILAFPQSAYAKEKGVQHLNGTDLTPYLKMDDEVPLFFKGEMLDALVTCDTLLMQYYEEPDNARAAFGNTAVTAEDWQRVGHLFDCYNALKWQNEANALHQARNLITEIKGELGAGERKFSFICGHDINIACILTALHAEAYSLPGTIAAQTPIGGKIVLEERTGRDGTRYIGVSLMYQSDDQLRNNRYLSLAEPPMRYPLRFKELAANEDGLYRQEDFLQLLTDAVSRYEELAGE